MLSSVMKLINMTQAWDKEKNRLPDMNRTHDLLPGVPEVTDLIPVGKSQFFFLHPPVMLINSPSTAMELIQGAL